MNYPICLVNSRNLSLVVVIRAFHKKKDSLIHFREKMKKSMCCFPFLSNFFLHYFRTMGPIGLERVLWHLIIPFKNGFQKIKNVYFFVNTQPLLFQVHVWIIEDFIISTLILYSTSYSCECIIPDFPVKTIYPLQSSLQMMNFYKVAFRIWWI